MKKLTQYTVVALFTLSSGFYACAFTFEDTKTPIINDDVDLTPIQQICSKFPMCKDN
ncbi:hypothetical protein [Thalassotalea euphylliae]|uniref:hypothetical protein n=1 Tax=Thalassotalea euphylliae TaxID=1655234 RepID=UPI0015F273B7|nr:hypothetical protein [Thalassotalea euphylliae]